MSKIALFLLLVVGCSAATVTLKNETETPRVMEARGASVVIQVEVPALSTVTVDVGEAWFDRDEFLYAFCAGVTVISPFLAYGCFRRIVQETP